MTLEQIGVMLDDGARERHQVLQAHLDDFDRRMEDMIRSREMTEHAMNCRSHDIATFLAALDDGDTHNLVLVIPASARGVSFRRQKTLG